MWTDDGSKVPNITTYAHGFCKIHSNDSVFWETCQHLTINES